ncbi:S-adenosyl-L-methionine-dependent methyltransferase [Dipodascopsis tothii]|uniref:S-adenosyl-L-methionine-dependent methyltransferase n=1 Tax=Dipodascopsis tothii TaxID=44089 RepID=UPI0034CD112C
MPSTTRDVAVAGQPPVELFEPTLTADSLGFKTWGSALLLAERLVAAGGRPVEPPVIELGAGTGLVAVVLARLGLDVLATDLAEIVPNLAANVARNLAGVAGAGTVTVEALDWARPADSAAGRRGDRFASVVLSDPLYSPGHAALVMTAVRAVLAPGGRVVLQVPLRAGFEDVRAEFWQRLRAAGLARVAEAEQDGADDFGAARFYYSVWAAPADWCIS